MNKVQILLTTVILLLGINSSGIAGFDDGYDAFKKGSYKAAFNEWKPLAEQGDADAQYWLGSFYDHSNWGEVVRINYEEAFRWYSKSAEQGCA